MNRQNARLKLQLEKLYRSYGRAHLESDPVQFLHRYSDPLDQEIVGLISSALAYGNVQQIRRSIEDALRRIPGSPRRFVESFDPIRDGARFNGFVHRFNQGRDLASFLFLLRQVIQRSGSVGEFFAPHTGQKILHLKPALISFIDRIEALDPGPFYGGRFPKSGSGVRFFLSSPREGSACKRMCLYLRWMVRHDEVDLGIWKMISRSALIMPIDTHIARIAHRLKLMRLPNATWKNAEELTERLRSLSPQDPVRYDFALSRIGIVEGWPRRSPQQPMVQRILTHS